MNRSVNTDEKPRTAESTQVTLNEIRLRGQKPRYRQIGNWLARHWARPTAVYGSWVALRLGISADAVTAAAAIAWLLEAVGLGLGTPAGFMTGVGLGYLGFWLDHVDGQVARVRGSDRVDGIFFDFWIHTAHACLRGFGLGWGLFAIAGDPFAILAGMSASFGWVMISHANDSAYKAIFARAEKLREQGHAMRVRPLPFGNSENSNRPDRSLLAWASWSLVKLQEPHCVLLVVTAVGLLLQFDRHAGIQAWRSVLVFWAVTAPLVAVLRLIRKLRSNQITAMFDDWFE